jgi:hypothetical protein
MGFGRITEDEGLEFVYGMTGIVVGLDEPEGVTEEVEVVEEDGVVEEAGTGSDDLGFIIAGIIAEETGKTLHFPLIYPNPTSQTH